MLLITQATVTQLADAIKNHDIITGDLKVIKKWSLQWGVICVIGNIMQPFYWLYGKDAFLHYRTHTAYRSAIEVYQQDIKSYSGKLTAEKARIYAGYHEHVLKPLKARCRFACSLPEVPLVIPEPLVIPDEKWSVRLNDKDRNRLGLAFERLIKECIRINKLSSHVAADLVREIYQLVPYDALGSIGLEFALDGSRVKVRQPTTEEDQKWSLNYAALASPFNKMVTCLNTYSSREELFYAHNIKELISNIHIVLADFSKIAVTTVAALARLEHAASSGEAWPEGGAKELLDLVYHTYAGDPKELPAQEELYKLEKGRVVFNKKALRAVHAKVFSVVHGALELPRRELPVISTATFKGRYSGPVKIDYTDGINLAPTVPEDVRIFASLPIPLPVPFDEASLEARKKAIIALGDNEIDKRLIAKALGAIKFISFARLLTGLEKGILRANELLKDRPYEALIQTEKSNSWMTHLALRLGLHPPQALAGGKYPSDTLELDTLLICDDCAYSGAQIFDFITKACKSGTKKHIVILVPFMTNTAYKLFNEHPVKEKGVTITVITSDEKLVEYPELLPDGTEFDRFEELFQARVKWGGTTLAFTEWKVPDRKSVPLNLFWGVVRSNPDDRSSIKQAAEPVYGRHIPTPYAPLSAKLG